MPPSWRSILVRGGLLLVLAGCAPAPVTPVIVPAEFVPDGAISIPANRVWTDTGLSVRSGQALTISATGRVQLGRFKGDTEQPAQVGPEGTFLYGDALHDKAFPMPAAGRGPAPCFCLIGRIGHGRPFFIGRGRSWVPEETGTLWLGINDYDARQNTGEFYAEITRPSDVQPVAYRSEVPLTAVETAPRLHGRVVVIYVDGLRPDVVEEMAAMGHIPNLRKHFVEGGAHLRNTFTVFPSDTITSNGTMWTGCFSDRHGLKGQIRFSRFRQQSDSFLEPLGPSRSARQLQQHGVDKALLELQENAVRMVHGKDAAESFRQRRTSDTPAIFSHLRAQGDDWSTGVLPIMTAVPPPLWTRSMARCLPYLNAQDAWRYIDDANTTYAVRYLLRDPKPVTIIWLPETDSVSHKECRGQFGSTRRTIARADALVGEIVKELEGQGRLQETFLVLVSDHGHHGGQDGYLQRFDLTNELLYHPREVTADGKWVGGGLGLSVRQHRFTNAHADDGPQEYVFIDGDSDGTARLFFPKTHYRSHDWTGPSNPADLLAYRVSVKHAPVNLPLTLANATKVDAHGDVQHPIDLVLMRIAANAILITTHDRGQAIIERQRSQDDGCWLYRYTPVCDVRPLTNGRVSWKVSAESPRDPLGLVEKAGREFLKRFHDETIWLWVTAGTKYPDSVVTLTRHMLWQDNLREQEQEYASDLVVTAKAGWLLGLQNTPGTTHGYPLAESMRATWYVSGPGVRRGARVEAPCRLADLTPTILELTGTPFDASQMDGRALRTIYEPEPGTEQPAKRFDEIELAGKTVRVSLTEDVRNQALYWSEVDLLAWDEFTYSPDPPYANLPKSMNNPASGWDLNNIAYNAMAIGDWSVLRLADDALSAVTPGRTHLQERVKRLETRAAHSGKPWLADGVQALNLADATITDYSLTSSGNLKRMDRSVDWLQNREARLDQHLSQPWGRRGVLGSRHTNRVIDKVQLGLADVYRFGQRWMAQILDETVLNGIENGVDSAINSGRTTPAEVVVPRK